MASDPDRPRPPLPDYVDLDTGEVFSPAGQRALVRAEATGVANPFTGEGFMPPLSWVAVRGAVASHKARVAWWMHECQGFFKGEQ